MSMALEGILRRIHWNRAALKFNAFSQRHISDVHSFTPIFADGVQFGQPLPETHPHLLRPGELTRGITALEYHHRRSRLCEQLAPGSVAILAAASVKYRSGAVFYDFRQASNFAYLTGFLEPDAIAVIEKGQSGSDYTFHLFVRPKDPHAEQWDGPRSGIRAARDVFNADQSGDINNAANALKKLITGAAHVYADFDAPRKAGVVEGILSSLGSTNCLSSPRSTPGNWRSLSRIMNTLRLVKTNAELECMRIAGRISGTVISSIMQKAYDNERHLWMDLSHGYKTDGLDGDAYIPVVAGGSNALGIHYVRNDALLNIGELVLVDSGGEYGGYATDITRTWPVGTRFSDAQRDMYEMVLAVQEHCVSLCREDSDLTLDGLHHAAEDGLCAGLRDLGFNMSGRAIDVLFPHHVGHYVGLDVHDAPGMSRSTKLGVDQCITIEPGIYVPDDPRWPSHFRKMGIRIEDTIRIGKKEPEVITRFAAKSLSDIEQLRRGVQVTCSKASLYSTCSL